MWCLALILFFSFQIENTSIPDFNWLENTIWCFIWQGEAKLRFLIRLRLNYLVILFHCMHINFWFTWLNLFQLTSFLRYFFIYKHAKVSLSVFSLTFLDWTQQWIFRLFLLDCVNCVISIANICNWSAFWDV